MVYQKRQNAKHNMIESTTRKTIIKTRKGKTKNGRVVDETSGTVNLQQNLFKR